MNNCIYCAKELKKNDHSHQKFCKKNPERKIISRSGERNGMFGKRGKNCSNQFKKAKEENRIVKFSEESINKMKISSTGKKHGEKTIEKIKKSMKEAVRKNPESYSASNINGRTKKSIYKNIILDSNWEIEFAKWCDEKNIAWEKNIKGFEYEYKGNRIYYPDFYLPEVKLYVEIKGYEREKDKLKWKAVPGIIIIKRKEIEKIKRRTFNLVP